MVLNMTDWFVSGGIFLQNLIVQHFGRSKLPFIGTSSIVWQDYVKTRLLPFGGPPIAFAIILAILLPFAFCFVKCCFGKSRMGGNTAVRVVITIIAIVFAVQLVAASIFVLLSMRDINSSYTAGVVPIIEDTIQSAKLNLTTLGDIAKEYPELGGELSAKIAEYSRAFDAGTADLNKGISISKNVVHGLSIAAYCFGALGVVVAVLVLIFVRIKCGRASFAILSMIAFLLFGLLATSFVVAGVVAIDVEPALDASVIVKECPTQQDLQSTLEELENAKQLAEAGMNVPGADKAALQKAIDDANSAIDILDNFIGCVGATTQLHPAIETAVHTIGGLFLFTSLLGVIILIILLFLYVNVLCHGCCWSKSNNTRAMERTKYINMIQPEESAPLIYYN